MSKLVLEVVEADALKVGDHVRIGGRARTFVGDGGTPRERVTLQRRTPDAEERTLEVPLIWWRVYEIMEFDIEQRGGGHVGQIGIRTGRSKAFDVKWVERSTPIERLRASK